MRLDHDPLGRQAAREVTVARVRGGDDEAGDMAQRGLRVKASLRARLGEKVFSSWFVALEFQSFDGRNLKVTVPVKFLRSWIQSHYADALIACAKPEFAGIETVEVLLREPKAAVSKTPSIGQQRP